MELKPPPAPKETAESTLNKRQRWVLEQIAKGVRLKQKTVLDHFSRDCNASTVKRDLKGLRDAGLIETGAEGYYVRSKNDARGKEQYPEIPDNCR